MPDRKLILVFPFALQSHYLRCLVLVDRYYSGDEYDVRFLQNADYDHYIRHSGYETFSCEQFDVARVMDDSRCFNFSWLNLQDINRIFNSQVDCILSNRPALVIGDMAPTLKMAAEFTGVHYLSLLNGYMTPYCLNCRSLPSKHPSYYFLRHIPQKILMPLTAFGESRAFRKIHQPFKIIREKHHLKSVQNYLEEMQGDENLICDLPELFPQKNLPANYKFVEPLIYHDPAPDNTWLARIDPAKPVIFVCMGSTGDWEKLKFLNDAQYSAFNIISAGDGSTVLTATHIISRPFVNLSSVLAISSLMICHGGNGTIYHGLLAGVPMLCLTSHFEQEWNVKALEKLGYGISADDFSEEQWWEHIRMTALRKMTPYFKQKSAENATELTEHAARSRPLF